MLVEILSAKVKKPFLVRQETKFRGSSFFEKLEPRIQFESRLKFFLKKKNLSEKFFFTKKNLNLET
jgi:hypothetical protein